MLCIDKEEEEEGVFLIIHLDASREGAYVEIK